MTTPHRDNDYRFPGDGSFLEAALAEAGADPAAAGEARRWATYGRLTSLLSQAAHGDPAHAAAILAGADRQLRAIFAVAAAAHDALQHTAAGLGLVLRPDGTAAPAPAAAFAAPPAGAPAPDDDTDDEPGDGDDFDDDGGAR